MSLLSAKALVKTRKSGYVIIGENMVSSFLFSHFLRAESKVAITKNPLKNSNAGKKKIAMIKIPAIISGE